MNQDIIIKFCIVGQPGVGKTYMLCQYIHEKFDQKVRPTIGCDFSTKLKSIIDGKPVKLQLWDIAVQERFNAVSKMYLQGALGCVIVCSALQKNTLDQTTKWMKIIEDNSEYGNDTNIPCLLVQNKSDLRPADNPEEYQKKQYLEEVVKTNGYCGSIKTSAYNVNYEYLKEEYNLNHLRIILINRKQFLIYQYICIQKFKVIIHFLIIKSNKLIDSSAKLCQLLR